MKCKRNTHMHFTFCFSKLIINRNTIRFCINHECISNHYKSNYGYSDNLATRDHPKVKNRTVFWLEIVSFKYYTTYTGKKV